MFWEQGEAWQPVEQHLSAATARLGRALTPGDEALAASAEKEVACCQALFTDDLAQAVTLAQEVTDRLIGGSELRPYRALWFYLAASWASRLAAVDSTGWAARAEELRREAEGTARTLRWTPRWLDSPSGEEQVAPEERGARAATKLLRLGIRGRRFDQHIDDTMAKLGTDGASEFEEGLLRVGELLGFEAVRPNGQADPDGAWRDGVAQWILFEAKTEERPDTPLSAEAVRQAGTHHLWVESKLEWERPEHVVTTIVTYKAAVDPAAAAIAADVRMVAPDVVRGVAGRAFDALREVRAAARGLTDDALAERLSAAFAARGLDTSALAAELGPRRVGDG